MYDKKKDERKYLDAFLQLRGIVPGTIDPGESPDFIMSYKGKQIGLEITEYHSSTFIGFPRRAVESEWEKLQGLIMAEVKKHDELKHTSGILFFKSLKVPSSLEQHLFVEELIKISIKMVQLNINEYIPDYCYPLLKKYLENFSLENTRCYIVWDWNHDAGSVGITEDELLGIIDTKIKKASKYQKVDELWLIIISSYRISQSAGILFPETLNDFRRVESRLKDSSFRKIYIYQYMLNCAFEWPGWSKIRL